MLYQKQTFTLPTTNRRMTDEEYEIAVGLRPRLLAVRCEKCAGTGYKKGQVCRICSERGYTIVDRTRK